MAAGQSAGLGRHFDLLTGLNARALLFGQRKIDPQRRRVLKRRDLRPGRNKFAQLDLRDADLAAERRLDDLLVDLRLNLLHLCLGRGQVRLRFLHR